GAARLRGANHVHHALPGAVDRLRARGKDGDAHRLLVLLDGRRRAALALCPLYPRPGFHPGPRIRSFRLRAQPLFRVARPSRRAGHNVKGEGRNAPFGPSMMLRLPRRRRVLCSRDVRRTLEAAMTLTIATTSQRHAAAGAVEVVPTGRALGAEVRRVDLSNLDEAAFARLMQAWHQHSVVLIRDQSLSDQELIAFSRRLGDLDWAPIQETGRRFVAGLPEIYVASNTKVNGHPSRSIGHTAAA